MKRYALCVGLTHLDPDRYDGWDGDCPGCDRDAAAIARLCHDAGFDGVNVLINAAATKLGIKAAFLESVKGMAAGDLLLLYVSGHGGQQPDTDGDEDDGRDETLCLYDGEVVDDTIAGYLSTIPRGVRVLFISDTCNSGTNYRGVNRGRPSPVKLNRKATQTFRGSLLHFGGCADGRSSFGADDGGVFTLALLDVLRKARKPLTYGEWFKRAAARMPKKQTPVANQWGTGDFERMEALT